MAENKQEFPPANGNLDNLQGLREKIDPHLIKSREGWRDRSGNVHMVEYVEWHTVADLLDRHTPNWMHKICDIKQIGEVFVVVVSITIGDVSREGIGTGSAETELGIKKAEHDALKRAAVKFGVGRELYKKETEFIERHGSSPAYADNNGTIVFPRDPVAKSHSDLVTAKQLGMIRALARELEIDADEECAGMMDCKSDELSKKAASALIQHLQILKEGFDSAAKTGEETIKKNNVEQLPVPDEKLKEIGKKLAENGAVTADAKSGIATVTETKNGRPVKFTLHKNGTLKCNCARYEHESKKNAEFWCEHKWAFKFHLETKPGDTRNAG